MKRVAFLAVGILLVATRPAPAADSSSNPVSIIFNTLTGMVGSTATMMSSGLTALSQCVEADGGIGPGFKLGLEAVVVRIGLGNVRSWRGGIDGRQVGTWTERDAMLGLAPFSLLLAPCELMKGSGGMWTGLANAFEMTSLGVERIERDNFSTPAILYHKSMMIGGWHQRPGDGYSLGAEAHLVFLGGRLRFKPVQMVAAVLGLFGMNISARLEHPDAASYYPGISR